MEYNKENVDKEFISAEYTEDIQLAENMVKQGQITVRVC